MDFPTEPRHLLVVDDDPTLCEVLSLTLGELGYEVVTETDPLQVIDLLNRHAFDVLLLDVVMPGIDGLELMEQIREDFTVLPILMVTGHGDTEMTLAAMRRGATDFISKPVEGSVLDLCIRRAYDLQHARRLANTDGLTGLYNHRHLQERLRHEVERARRYSRPLSLVMMDLDHFKTYNDRHGHPAGDEVLIAVAKTLRQVSRTSDLVARYGGEEFTLVLPETSLEEATLVSERARECIAQLEFPPRDANGKPASVTASFGVATYTPGGSREDLLRAADDALYQSKRAGRDRTTVARPSLTVADPPQRLAAEG